MAWSLRWDRVISLGLLVLSEMSGDIILGIDNISLLLLCALISVELYGAMIGNDVLLLLGFAAIMFVCLVRIRNRKRISS